MNKGEKKKKKKEHRNKDVERLFGVNLMQVSLQNVGTILEVDKYSIRVFKTPFVILSISTKMIQKADKMMLL